MSGNDSIRRALAAVRAQSGGSGGHGRITVNFHPDRLTRDGVPLLVALARDPRLRSQFETGTSNGGLSAHPGGARWHWEHRAFSGAYDDAPAACRPKYGALDYSGASIGAAPRFGSAVWCLSKSVLSRSTFCYPDSVFEPNAFAPFDDVQRLIHLAEDSVQPDPLDSYIEAHIHGDVSLASDVDALVLDPVFRGTAIETQARALPVALHWHQGFRVSMEVVDNHPEYRGVSVAALAHTLSRAGYLDPRGLGEAIEYGGCDPQRVKKVWHYLARFGAPTERFHI